MRFTKYLIPTQKEIPADAIIGSHILMLRAGMIKKLAAGIYDYLPLALRTLHKIENIIREEMEAAGALELLMPVVQPAALWEESGRWGYYGPELARFKDRKGTDYCLGPTHEEVITDLFRNFVSSYKSLPLNLFQIQVKFRDEIRPRFGLMRGREFIMKDGYSFDLNEEGALQTYRVMDQAYRRIFSRCGLQFKAVEAGSGAMGGSISHEFQVLAENGEDTLLSCSHCVYAANLEKAECRPPQQVQAAGEIPAIEKVATPSQRTIEEVAAFLQVTACELIKTLIYMADGKPVVVLVRGDYTISEAKLLAAFNADEVLPATAEQILEVTGAPVGFAGPVGLKKDIPIYCDFSVMTISSGISGANAKDLHLKNVNPQRDFPQTVVYADLRLAGAEEPCPRCGEGVYELHRGIEAGQLFYLGTKYSRRMHAFVLDEHGKQCFPEMGCYGIGVTRTMAAAVEQHHDEYGIIWPFALAPFQVIICPVGKAAEINVVAEKIYQELLAGKIEVLLDDRGERPGVMFKDADLTGIPLRITVGSKALADNAVEVKLRRDAETSLVSVGDVARTVTGIIERELACF